MIVINGKFLLQRKTGVQRFAYELTMQLIESGAEIEIAVPKHADVTATGIPPHFFKKTGFFKNLTLWEQFDLGKYIRGKKDAILLSLCNTGPALLKRQIVCIHDMSYYQNPDWFSKGFSAYYKYLIPKIANTALHIITVSKFSKNEICEKLGIPLKKVSVINNAPSDRFVVADQHLINFQKDDFFLFVGSHDPRKNIGLLLKLFSLKEYSSFKLLIIGAAATSKSFNSEELVIPKNIQFITDCDDAMLADYYKHAKALINTSFYEGFGLPIVEAMASGCPLIISDISAFKEIAQKNACYFNPGSLQSFKIAVNSFMKKTEAENNALITKNYNLSFNYNWKSSSDDLVQIIQNLKYELN